MVDREVFDRRLAHLESWLRELRRLARSMEGWAGLRNLLVHLYLEVDPARLYEILRQDLDELERYARELARTAR